MAELGPLIFVYRAWKLQLYRAIWNAVQRYWTAERWIRVANNEGLAQFIQLNGLGMDASGRPAIVNAVGAVDVDILLEEGPDVGSMLEETGDALKGYPPGTFPPQVLIELSRLPRSEKNRILAMIMPKPQPPNPLQDVAARLALESAAADVAKKAAEVRKTHASAEQALATADEKRTKAGHATFGAHLDAAEFARDTLVQAQQLERQLQQPQPGPQGPQTGPQAPAAPPQ